MEDRKIPYEGVVLVCANVREGGRKACGNPGSGGAEICAALKDAVKAAGLAKKVRVTRSGCLGLCEHGPNVVFLPSGDWRSGVTLADVPRLLGEITGKAS